MFELEPMSPISMELYPLPVGNLKACPTTLEDLLDSMVDEREPDHSRIDFVNGWNAAMKYVREDTMSKLPNIERLIFNNPATIIYWDDGTKTVVKYQPGDTFNVETGMAMAMLKRFMGNDNTFNRVIAYYLDKSVTHLSAPPEAAE